MERWTNKEYRGVVDETHKKPDYVVAVGSKGFFAQQNEDEAALMRYVNLTVSLILLYIVLRCMFAKKKRA